MSTAAWMDTTLGEIAEIVGGATPKTTVDEYWDGDVYWATPKDLSELDGAEIDSTPRTLTQAGLRSCSTRVLPPGSVLLSSRAPIGHVAINTVPMATNQGFKSLVPDRDRADAKFLYWWLRRNRPALEAMGTGATFKEISKKTTSAVPIKLPPIEEQRRIAAVLDAADTIRAKRREALAKLDTLTQGIFVDMFGDPRLGTHDQVRLADHVEVVTKGTTPTSVGMDFTDEGVHFVRATDLVAGTVDATRVELRISASTHASLARSQLKPGDVLVSIAGTIGRVAVVPDNAPEMNCNQAVALVRTKPSLLPDYLAAWLNTGHAQDQMTGSKVTGTISNLSLSSINKLKVPLPDLDAQVTFVERVESVASHNNKVALMRAGLDDLFAALQTWAFRGEL